MKKNLVVLSGAGISAESGIRTFRAADGLWEEHAVEDVASPEGWQRNPDLVRRFYNARRQQVLAAQPNAGHKALAKLEEAFDVRIITQNIDDLHERAGSSQVLHLHGEILVVRSSIDPELRYSWTGDLSPDDICPHGEALRPDVVWFGEAVPLMTEAAFITHQADAFLVVGTSLAVYPAASLLHLIPEGVPRFLVDPVVPPWPGLDQWTVRAQSAAEALPGLVDQWLEAGAFDV